MIGKNKLRAALKASSEDEPDITLWLAARGIDEEAFFTLLHEGAVVLRARQDGKVEEMITLLVMGFCLGWETRDAEAQM